jgi:hypothetical protein
VLIAPLSIQIRRAGVQKKFRAPHGGPPRNSAKRETEELFEVVLIEIKSK